MGYIKTVKRSYIYRFFIAGMFCLTIILLLLYLIQYGPRRISRDYAYYYQGNIYLVKGKDITTIKFHNYGNGVNYSKGVVFDICGDKLIGVDTINEELFVVDLVDNNKQIIMKKPDDSIWRVSSDGRYMLLDSKENFYIVDIAKKCLISKGKAHNAYMSPFGDGALALEVDNNRVIITNISNMNKTYMSFTLNTSRSHWDYDFKNKCIYIMNYDDSIFKRYDYNGNVKLLKVPFIFGTTNLLWQPNREEVWISGTRGILFYAWYVYDKNGVLLGRLANPPDGYVFTCRAL